MRRVPVMMIMTGMLTASQSVCGDVLPIENAGFENPVLADDEFSVTAPGWDLYNPAKLAPIGVHGCWNPPTGAYPDEAPEGDNVGWVYWLFEEPKAILGMSQTLEATLQADTTYTLTVQVGNTNVYNDFLELAGFPGYRIELLAGDTVLAADMNSLVLNEGEFGLSSINYTAGPKDANLGMALTIRLINLLDAPGVEADFDDVVLTAEFGLPCPADLDTSGDVGVKDLLFLLGAWGPCPPKGGCPADFDDSGDVGVKDLLFLLGVWGACP